MEKWLIILAIVLLPAWNTVSKTDNLGYTHTQGEGIRGLSHTDSLGYRHEQWDVDGQRTNCTVKKDSLGYVHRNCN